MVTLASSPAMSELPYLGDCLRMKTFVSRKDKCLRFRGTTIECVTVLLAQIPGAFDLVTGLLPTTLISPAWGQQAQDSDFMTDLNAGGDTVAGTEYTTIGSRVDEVVQPNTSIALRDSAATNVMIQDLCRKIRPAISGCRMTPSLCSS